MPESILDKKVFSLAEVTASIRKTLADRYASSFWVKAEMNKLNHYTQSGHCHPELLEKRDGQVVAQVRANLWKTDYQRINQQFIQVLKEPLKDGIKIMFLASVQYDPMYGLSLRIHDIDPSFALGELEREKQESIDRLKKEGIFNHNKSLSLPLLAQRIAVISVETSKGYADFLNVLQSNKKGYRFFLHLFPALLQGDKSVESIIDQLNRIRKVIHHFDAVTIIRGGGGDVGLSSYNHYNLARTIATFPIPVLTGIGHSTNETVSEMVSYRSSITPTELADFFIRKFDDFDSVVDQCRETVIDFARNTIANQKQLLEHEIKFMATSANHFILSRKSVHQVLVTSLINKSAAIGNRQSWLLQTTKETLSANFKRNLAENRTTTRETQEKLGRVFREFKLLQVHRLEQLEGAVKNLDPVNVFKRGFTITTVNGKVAKSIKDVQTGEKMITMFADGKTESTINTILKDSNE